MLDFVDWPSDKLPFQQSISCFGELDRPRGKELRFQQEAEELVSLWLTLAITWPQ